MKSILDLPRLGDDPLSPFPGTGNALDSPNGLLAWGGDLHPERMLAAYRDGIFPWYSEGQPILWWSPAPRSVICPEDVYLSTRTRRRHNSGVYRLTADTAFAEVVKGCAGPRNGDGGTWITEDMQKSYGLLHETGHAHSVEVWSDERLVGGIYGLAIGSIFFGESMFSSRIDASKIALIALCRQLKSWGYGLLDCQVGNPHLMTMGAIELSRPVFEHYLKDLVSDARSTDSWDSRFGFESRW